MKDLKGWCIGLGIAFFLLGLSILGCYILRLIPDHLNVQYELSLQKSAYIGEFIGGMVGVFFSGAAFLILYSTLILQQKETAKSEKIVQRQFFENFFFQLWNKQIDYRDKLNARINYSCNIVRSITQSDIFEILYEKKIKQQIPASLFTDKDKVKGEFDTMIKDENGNLAHYFKYLITIMEYVFNFSSQENSKHYYSIILSQMSQAEKLLLFYYTIFYTQEPVKKVIGKTGLIDEINKNRLLNEKNIEWF